MALVKWNSLLDKPVSSLVDSLFNRDIADFLGDWKGTQPAVNISESEDEYKVEVAAPGMAKENFDVKIQDNVLFINGKKEENKENNKDHYMSKEFQYSSFQRSFHLSSEEVDANNIQATYKDGILCVTLPKREEAKMARVPKQISIN